MAGKVNNATSRKLLLDQTLTFAATGTLPTNQFSTVGFNYIRIIFWQKAITGTSATMSADLIITLPDASTIDIFNNGPQQFSFSYNIGPGLAQNFMPDDNYIVNMTLAATGAGTATYRVLAYGYI